MPENIIEVENLTKFYSDVVGVKNINFSVKKGEIFGFLGPNGAGKTTTIRLLLDLLKPSNGKIAILNQDLVNSSLEIRKKCGYLPGNFAAYAHLTGEEFLQFCAKMRDKSTGNINELLKKFKFDEKSLMKKIKHLSHGNLQKLGILQAFFHNPHLIILDEPTLGLDPLMQEVFYSILLEYRNNGGTVFFSSHNLTEVEKICDRIAIIRNGNLAAVEKLEDLKKKRFRKLTVQFKKSMEDIKAKYGSQIVKTKQRNKISN